MNGQLAAIQPIVPQTRMKPKSFWASLILANAIALVTDIVGHEEEAVQEHQAEERPERLLVGQAEHRQAADQVAEGQELLLGEIAVGELAAEEHPGDRRDRERVEDPGLLVAGELQVVLPMYSPRSGSHAP